MKRIYVLVYRTGWGETVKQDINAYNISDALTVARNFCKAHLGYSGWVHAPNGVKYLV